MGLQTVVRIGLCCGRRTQTVNGTTPIAPRHFDLVRQGDCEGSRRTELDEANPKLGAFLSDGFGLHETAKGAKHSTEQGAHFQRCLRQHVTADAVPQRPQPRLGVSVAADKPEGQGAVHQRPEVDPFVEPGGDACSFIGERQHRLDVTVAERAVGGRAEGAQQRPADRVSQGVDPAAAIGELAPGDERRLGRRARLGEPVFQEPLQRRFLGVDLHRQCRVAVSRIGPAATGARPRDGATTPWPPRTRGAPLARR